MLPISKGALLPPSPLRGGVGGGGGYRRCRRAWSPPPPPLPRKGGGRRKRSLARRHLRRPALRQTACAARAGRAVAAELIEPDIKIDAVTAEPAFGENSGDLRSRLARAPTMRIHDHARQPRRERQRAQAPGLRRDPAIAVDRPEFAQQASRLLQRGR